MPDPVSNAEIEDVLSSIRRLVSDEPEAGQRKVRAIDSVQDRLVLTPAQRVSDNDGTAANGAGGAAGKPDTAEALRIWQPEESDNPDLSDIAAGQGAAETSVAETDTETEEVTKTDSLSGRVAGLEAALLLRGGEWEPDGSEDGSDDETRPLSADAGFDMAEAWEEGEPPDWHEDVAEEPGAETAEAEAAAETPAEDTTVESVVQLDDGVDEIADAIEAAVAETGDVTQPGLADEDDGLPDFDIERGGDRRDASGGRGAYAFSRDEAPEDFEEWEPEETGADDDRDDAPMASASSVDEAVADDPDDDDFDLYADDAVIDEEALRELVAELVRQELQGVLGERITRNVRRLVRREIERALALRDLT